MWSDGKKWKSRSHFTDFGTKNEVDLQSQLSPTAQWNVATLMKIRNESRKHNKEMHENRLRCHTGTYWQKYQVNLVISLCTYSVLERY